MSQRLHQFIVPRMITLFFCSDTRGPQNFTMLSQTFPAVPRAATHWFNIYSYLFYLNPRWNIWYYNAWVSFSFGKEVHGPHCTFRIPRPFPSLCFEILRWWNIFLLLNIHTCVLVWVRLCGCSALCWSQPNTSEEKVHLEIDPQHLKPITRGMWR